VRALRIRRTFVWDPGDGSDIVEGQSGTDTLLFNGAAGAEIFAASSNGGRLLSRGTSATSSWTPTTSRCSP
jgi:hypothetical protein